MEVLQLSLGSLQTDLEVLQPSLRSLQIDLEVLQLILGSLQVNLQGFHWGARVMNSIVERGRAHLASLFELAHLPDGDWGTVVNHKWTYRIYREELIPMEITQLIRWYDLPSTTHARINEVQLSNKNSISKKPCAH